MHFFKLFTPIIITFAITAKYKQMMPNKAI